MLNTLYNLLSKLGRMLSLNGGTSEIAREHEGEYEAQVATKRVTDVIDHFDAKMKAIEQAYPLFDSVHAQLDATIAKLPPVSPK